MSVAARAVFALRIWLLISVAFLDCSLCLHAQEGLPECSMSKTNKSCELVIDRSNPVAPPTVQMYSGQQLTVRIKNPLPFERYFLDFTTGQAAVTPDVTSAIIQGLIPDLEKFQATETEAVAHVTAPKNAVDACESKGFSDPAWPAKGQVQAARTTFDLCFGELAKLALQTYKTLEPLVAPDSLTQTPLPAEPAYYRGPNRQQILNNISTYLKEESKVSNKITELSKGPSDLQPPASPVASPPPVYSADDEVAITELAGIQKITDAISADLSGYNQRIADIGVCNYGSDAKDQLTAKRRSQMSSFSPGRILSRSTRTW